MVFEKFEFDFLLSSIDDFVPCLLEEVVFFLAVVVLFEATVELLAMVVLIFDSVV